MSAYVIVEASVRDEAAYVHIDGVACHRPWLSLFGEPTFENGMVVRSPDKATVFAWYHSPDYQSSPRASRRGPRLPLWSRWLMTGAERGQRDDRLRPDGNSCWITLRKS